MLSRIPENASPWAMVIALMIVVCFFAFFAGVIAYSEHTRAEEIRRMVSALPFLDGDTVCMKTSSDKGMIVGTDCRQSIGCTYNVRFTGIQMRTDSRWGRDGAVEISPVSLVEDVKPFELEGCK